MSFDCWKEWDSYTKEGGRLQETQRHTSQSEECGSEDAWEDLETLFTLPLLPNFVGASVRFCEDAAERSAPADPASLASSEKNAHINSW